MVFIRTWLLVFSVGALVMLSAWSAAEVWKLWYWDLGFAENIRTLFAVVDYRNDHEVYARKDIWDVWGMLGPVVLIASAAAMLQNIFSK